MDEQRSIAHRELVQAVAEGLIKTLLQHICSNELVPSSLDRAMRSLFPSKLGVSSVKSCKHAASRIMTE
jgi:hypothetical protein